MDKSNRYIIAFDVMNVAACIAVIALHVNGAFWGFSYQRYWKTCLITETVFYWAVPLFFMLSGATLMNYRDRYTTKEYFSKRFSKTLIPFLFWSVVSIPWAIYISKYLDISAVSNFSKLIDVIINTKAMSIYWFFLPLFSIYLSIPIISLIPENKRKLAFGFLILYSFFGDLLSTVCSSAGFALNPSLCNPMVSGYLIFPLIGYWISNYPLSRRSRIMIYALGFLGWAIRFFYTLEKSLASGKIDMGMSGYCKFPSVLLSVAVFTWFFYQDWSFLTPPCNLLLLKKLSALSFSIYLTHFYIMRAVIDIFQIPMQSIIWRIGGIPLTYLLSLVLSLILKRIPLIKYFLP